VNTDLLPEADPRSGVEGKEYERIFQKILLNPVVEEAIRIELVGWDVKYVTLSAKTLAGPGLPSGPQRSSRRCIISTE
jgi:hypothetical protein